MPVRFLVSSEKDAGPLLPWQLLLLFLLFVTASQSTLIQLVDDQNATGWTPLASSSLVPRARIGHGCTAGDSRPISRSLRRVVEVSSRALLGTRPFNREAWSERIFEKHFVDGHRPVTTSKIRQLQTEIHARFATIQWEARHSLATRRQELSGYVDIHCHHQPSQECPALSLPWTVRGNVLHLVCRIQYVSFRPVLSVENTTSSPIAIYFKCV